MCIRDRFISIFKDFDKKRKFSIAPIRIPNKPKPKEEEKKDVKEGDIKEENEEKLIVKSDENKQINLQKNIEKNNEIEEKSNDDIDLI